MCVALRFREGSDLGVIVSEIEGGWYGFIYDRGNADTNVEFKTKEREIMWRYIQ